MITLYLLTFGFGAVLVGASAVIGGGGDDDLELTSDVDVDADADADVELEGDHGTGSALAEGLGDDASAWVPFLSLRFWSFGSAAFGATGLLLTLADLPALVTAPVSAATGAGIGSAAAWFFRQLKSDVVTGTTSLARFIGEQATVVLSVRPGRTGTVRIETAAGDLVVPAVTHDRHELASGTRVLIASFDGRTADVTSLPRLGASEDGTG